MMDLNSRTCSFSCGYFSFRLPAAASTDFTARIPECVGSVGGGGGSGEGEGVNI